MKIVLKSLSWLGLLLTVGPSFLVFHQIIDLPTHKWIALIGSLLWIATAPFWINEQKRST
jgi:hypothetical protein